MTEESGIKSPSEPKRFTALPTRRERKHIPAKQRIAQIEEHLEQLTFAVLVLRDEVELLAKRPLLRGGAFKGAND